jgi:uncharacterized protein (TIGR02598 family)
MPTLHHSKEARETPRMRGENPCSVFRHHQGRKATAFRAFTLVEVAMALGIFAFGIIGIVGLLPVGLTAFRDSKAKAVQAMISQQRISELMQTPFQILTNASAPEYAQVTGRQFYTEEGVQIGDPVAAGTTTASLTPANYQSNAIYASQVVISPSLKIGTDLSTNVLRAVVEVARVSEPGRNVKLPVYVPNLGK